MDADGNLTYGKVIESLHLLGSKFFHEVQNGNKPSSRQKTYDVNFRQDEFDGEAIPENEEQGLMVQADLEESFIEQLHQEGDEDALIVSQFEHQILEVLQEDPSMASCFNTYVEARRKLSEKAKFRGFWQPSGGKGGEGKSKNRFKGKSSFPKRTLEQRIANSQCKRCFQWGHWKAECPQRHQSSTGSTSTPKAAFTGVAQHDEIPPSPWNFVDDDLPPENAVAFVAQVSNQDFQGSKLSFRVPFEHKKIESFPDLVSKRFRTGVSQHALAKCLSKLTHRMQPSKTDRVTSAMDVKPMVEPLSVENRLDHPPSVDEESAHFVSQGAEGIVDLGASLSVIGESQFQELCRHLPLDYQKSMKMAPCDISFRFGNDSTVQGTQAMFLPLGKWWMKLIVVPSNTPFLIANSLFRTLGAIIDTNKCEVHFLKLNCTVPIRLSERRLFMLDMVELIRRTPRINPQDQKEMSPQFICQCVSEKSSDHAVSLEGATAKPVQPVLPVLSKDCRSTSQETSGSDLGSKPSCQPHSICASTDLSEHGPVSCERVSGPGRALHEGHQQPGGSSQLGIHPSPEVRGSPKPCHGLREVQTGTPLSGGDSRQSLRELVCEVLRNESEADTCPTAPLREAACGAFGKNQLDSSEEQGLTSQCADFQTSRKSIVQRAGARGTGDFKLGASSSPRTRGGCPPRTSGQHGEHDAADPEPFDPRSNVLPSTVREEGPTPTDLSKVEPDWLKQCFDAIADHDQTVIDSSFFLDAFQSTPFEDNWVSREMWAYFQTLGDVTKHFSSPKHDLMEIYCSTDSELTKQGFQQGMTVSRFGLRDGDLSTIEGRKRLYDRIWLYRPAHLWMSPKCRAWCRWSTFNMHRSISSAKKVITSREEDRVHLLLCSALMELQHFRPRCHFHLEQPVGSHMMFQEEMRIIVTNTHRATCDMCVAGQLKHPETGKPIRKSTQVFTSSAILHRTLENLKCPRNHEHSVVEGSCTLPNGNRCAVSRFTELYTRTFATKVCKPLKCSLKIQAAVVALPEVICPAVATQDGKRRRLEEKQEPPKEYRQKALEDFIQVMKEQAPRVGKLVLREGPLFQQCAELFPGYKIVSLEACKGADRYRLPPAGVPKRSVPLRWSMGCHRNEAGIFSDNQWEEWTKITQKQAIRNCPPARLLITVLAQPIREDSTPEGSSQKRKENPIESEQIVKKHCPTDLSTGGTSSKTEEPISESKKQYHSHGPLFLSLEPEVRSKIMKLHKNLGHPDVRLLTRVLKEQQWDPQIVDKISDMVCPSCYENQKPRLARPAHISPDREFNDLLMIDGVEWTNQEGIKHTFYHMIDAATNFQIAIPAECRSTSHVSELLKTHWITWAGAPRTLMSDSAGEFCSEEFGSFLQSLDTKSVVIPAEAHWQLGRCERHGAILQNMLDKYQKDQPIRTSQDLREALLQCVQAKNSMSRVHGYTPEILVLGRSRHFPSCNSNETTGSSEWLAGESEAEEAKLESSKFLENMARREAARKAFVSADHDQKLRRALLRQSRPSRETFEKGQWVMFWRNGKAGQPSQWIGPGKVIVSEDPNVVWITYLSRLFRCAPEHIRAVSERECQPAMIEDNSATLPSQLGTGVFQYTDLTGNQAESVPVDHQTLLPPDHGPPPPVIPVPSGSSETTDTQPDEEPLQEPPAPVEIPVPDGPFSDDNGEDSALLQWEECHDHWKIKNLDIACLLSHQCC